MPAMYAGAAAAVGGLALNIANSGGGGSSSNGYGTGVPLYNLQTPQTADDNYIAAMQGFTNIGNTVGGYANGALGQQAQQGAQQASAYGTGTLAPMDQANAARLSMLGNQAVPYGSQLLQTAFDPQNALFAQQQNMALQNANVANAQAGLGGTPYGASVTANTLNNFDINWQNNLLQRQLAGAQGYGNFINDIGKGYSGASSLGNAGAGELSQYSSLPFNTGVGIQNQYGNVLSNEAQMSVPYLRLQGAAEGTALGAQNQGFNQAQTTGANIGGSLQQLAGLFGGNQNGSGGLGGLFGDLTGQSNLGSLINQQGWDYGIAPGGGSGAP